LQKAQHDALVAERALQVDIAVWRWLSNSPKKPATTQSAKAEASELKSRLAQWANAPAAASRVTDISDSDVVWGPFEYIIFSPSQLQRLQEELRLTKQQMSEVWFGMVSAWVADLSPLFSFLFFFSFSAASAVA
jgi:hypothetical protein